MTVMCIDEAAVGCVVLEGFRIWGQGGVCGSRLFAGLLYGLLRSFGGRGGAHHTSGPQLRVVTDTHVRSKSPLERLRQTLNSTSVAVGSSPQALVQMYICT